MIKDTVLHFVVHYGYIAIFIALMLELVGLPLPGEILMSYTGYLVSRGQLNWLASILLAASGAITGVTISYWIGSRLGTRFFHKYGSRFHMGPERLEKTFRLFRRYEHRILLIAYYIPGIRHITGYFSGVTGMPFRIFAVHAYIGAFIWAGTFISLGKIFGSKWEQFHISIRNYLIIGSIMAALLLAVIYLYRFYRVQIFNVLLTMLEVAVKTFHSLTSVKILLIATATVFLALLAEVAGLIQDYFSNEFGLFNYVVVTLVHLIFDQSWAMWMQFLGYLAFPRVMLTVIIFTVLWIAAKSREKLLENGFLIIVIVAGEVYNEGLGHIFHSLGTTSTFPSDQSLMAVIVYGLAGFLLVRHTGGAWFRILIPTMVLIMAALFGLSQIFQGAQYPSDILAGYVFGGVWLSFSILLLEVFRYLRKVNLQP